MRRGRHDIGGGAGPVLEAAGIGVALDQLVAGVAVGDFEAIQAAGKCLGNRHFPHARCAERVQGMNVAMPAVEIADHRNAPRVGCPHGKARASHAEHLARMRAQTFVGTQMRALG